MATKYQKSWNETKELSNLTFPRIVIKILDNEVS